MSDLYTKKGIAHTRKLHTCEFCGRDIAVGESAVNVFGIDIMDRWYCFYLCRWCSKHYGQLMDANDDFVFTPKTALYEYVWELIKYTDCPKCGGYDVDIAEDTLNEVVKLTCDYCDHVWTVPLAEALGLEKPQG